MALRTLLLLQQSQPEKWLLFQWRELLILLPLKKHL
jgi:hypothetical protein